MDILFIFDSSDSIEDLEFASFKSVVSSAIESTFPANGPRLGVMQFSTNTDIVVRFDDEGNYKNFVAPF